MRSAISRDDIPVFIYRQILWSWGVISGNFDFRSFINAWFNSSICISKVWSSTFKKCSNSRSISWILFLILAGFYWASEILVLKNPRRWGFFVEFPRFIWFSMMRALSFSFLNSSCDVFKLFSISAFFLSSSIIFYWALLSLVMVNTNTINNKPNSTIRIVNILY